jgi:peroxiredoxin
MFDKIGKMSFGSKKESALAGGAEAPAFELEDTDGQKFALAKAAAHGPVLAVFFKVSCPTCQFAFPFVERLHRRFDGQLVSIWGISQDKAEDSRGFAKKFGITFPILIDDRPYPVSQSYHLKYTPTLFLISPGGRLDIVSEGFSKKDFIAIEQKIAGLLSAKSELLFRPGERIPEFKPG